MKTVRKEELRTTLGRENWIASKLSYVFLAVLVVSVTVSGVEYATMQDAWLIPASVLIYAVLIVSTILVIAQVSVVYKKRQIMRIAEKDRRKD